jgi:hypothetical protein
MKGMQGDVIMSTVEGKCERRAQHLKSLAIVVY